MHSRAVIAPLSLLLALVRCASTPGATTPGANPHDMGATEHEARAADAAQSAAGHERQYDSDSVVECSGAQARGGAFGGTGLCWTALRDPNIRHAEQADELLKAAADHRAASQALRDAEARSCRGVADSDRDISPFAHRADIASVQTTTTGATIVFAKLQGLTVESLRGVVDCHLARNAALGHQVPEMPWCPLVPNHVTATVAADPDGRVAVTIASTDPDAAREVARRAQALRPSH